MLAFLSLLTLSAATGYGYFGRIESSRQPSPDGRYFEVVSHRPMYYLPLPIYRWGVHSDSPAFVSVEDSEGSSLGEVPVRLRQAAKIEWKRDSASIPALAEWDLNAKTCFYWADNQTHKIYTKKPTNGEQSGAG